MNTVDKKTKVIFRVDIDQHMGGGHLMRCLSLAQGFEQEGAEVLFVFSEYSRRYVERLETFKFESHYLGACLEERHSKLGHPENIFNCQAKPDIVVIDGYQFDDVYRKALLTLAHQRGGKIVALDDCNTLPCLYADVIVNPVDVAQNFGYEKTNPDAALLIGSSYLLMRPEFVEGRSLEYAKTRDITLCFGASDPLQLSEALLQHLLENKRLRAKFADLLAGLAANLVLITGAAYANPERIDLLCEQLQNDSTSLAVKHFNNVSNMAEFMEASRLFISAAGGSIFELQALSVPSLLVSVADNQVNAAKQHEAIGWCDHIDLSTNFSGDKIGEILEQSFSLLENSNNLISMHEKASAIKPINGVANVVSACLKEMRKNSRLIQPELEGYQVRVRPIISSDIERVRHWRNASAVRSVMLDQGEITKDQQIAWFHKVQDDASQWHFMVEYRDQAIGVINLKSSCPELKIKSPESISDATELEVGMYIGEEKYRGNIIAFAPALLINDYCFNTLNVQSLNAVVKINNEPALRFNEALGYSTLSGDHELDDDGNALVAIRLESGAYEAATKNLKRMLQRQRK